MRTLYIMALSLLMSGCANAQSTVNATRLELIGETLPAMRHITDMKMSGDTLLFVFETEDGFGQRFLRRAVVDRDNNMLTISTDMGKRDGGYYSSYMPYPFITNDGSVRVISQDDCEIYTTEQDTSFVRTKQYLMSGNSIVPFPLSQYVQDVYMTAPNKYVFIGREPKGGRQFAMKGDLSSATIDTIRQISISPELQDWMPNAGELAYSSKHNRLAFAFRLHPVIEIFGLDGSLLKTVKVADDTFNPATLEEADFDELNPIQFADISTNDNYIYALYWGHKYGETGQPQIYQLDWNGNIIAQHTLQDNIYKIAVLDDNMIIGWTGNEFVLISI